MLVASRFNTISNWAQSETMQVQNVTTKTNFDLRYDIFSKHNLA